MEARLAPAIARVADAVICNSEAGKQLCIRQGYDPDALFVVPNGIDTQRFRFDPVGRNRLRALWGVRDDELLIGVVARLDPMKDHATFLRAAKELAGAYGRSQFVCVGLGSRPYADMLRSLSADLGLDQQVRWVDEADDICGAYSALDVLCSSSMSEGFSNSIAEAMACERVCVVTDVGDARRIVGDTGRVVPARDHAALASACSDVARMPATERALLGARARRRVEEHFSVERLVDETQALLGL
jgi:glycosyltransferase involved in cell wall biosynthesis